VGHEEQASAPPSRRQRFCLVGAPCWNRMDQTTCPG
jgi:hypothetical protein